MGKLFKGIGASSGIVIGKAYILSNPIFSLNENTVNDVNKEIENYHKSIEISIDQLNKIKEVALKKLGEEKADVFNAHIQLVDDPEIKSEIEKKINEAHINAAWCIRHVYDKYYDIFKNMEDAYFKERASDIGDVKKRVLANVLNMPLPDIFGINTESIIVANDLTPSETALLDKKYIKGFVTEIGGRTSHAAIMARTMEIPAILGAGNILQDIKTGDTIAMNGSTGEMEINPIDLKKWKNEIARFDKEQTELKKFINVKTKTKDNHKVLIEANIGKPTDAELAIQHGCEGVGLYRSEFLYMNNDHWPTEEEQLSGYKKVLESMPDHLVVIRTLDIGGDKKLSYFTFPQEMNPFLGYRAIRFCLDRKDIFKVQLRALGRASPFGKLAIMFPMVATIDEFKTAKQFALDTFKELKQEGHKVSNDIQIGMMVEIPSSAALAKQFAKYSDFFSIGTNDLIQYSFACDRMSQSVAYLYQPNNPALLNLINSTIVGGHSKKRWVGMCGEMAGDYSSIPLLLGLGLDAFSMSATSMTKARMLINNVSFKECKLLASKALKLDTCKEVNDLVTQFLKKKKLL